MKMMKRNVCYRREMVLILTKNLSILRLAEREEGDESGDVTAVFAV